MGFQGSPDNVNLILEGLGDNIENSAMIMVQKNEGFTRRLGEYRVFLHLNLDENFVNIYNALTLLKYITFITVLTKLWDCKSVWTWVLVENHP